MSSPYSGLGRPPSVNRAFLDNASSGGIVLLAAAALALIVANSPLGAAYVDTLHAYIGGPSARH